MSLGETKWRKLRHCIVSFSDSISASPHLTIFPQGRIFSTNVPSVTREGTSWREFVEKLNPNLYEPQEPDLRYYPYNVPGYNTHHPPSDSDSSIQHHPSAPPPPSSSSSPPPLPFPASSSPPHIPQEDTATPRPPSTPGILSAAAHRAEIEAALDLLEHILHPESTKRMTPRRALAHPFLRGSSSAGLDEYDPEEDSADDDEFAPHVFGAPESVCHEWHSRDPVTEVPSVRVVVPCGCGCGREFEEVRNLVAGEGIAIGRQPCEFHRDFY